MNTEVAHQQLKAPGCFGAASVYSRDSKVCGQCPAFEACGEASLATLQAIRDRIDVRDLLKRHEAAKAAVEARKPEPVVEQAQPVPAAPKVSKPIERTTKAIKVTFEVNPDTQALVLKIGNGKAKDLALTLCKAGVLPTLKAELAAGRNPFDAMTQFRHVGIACRLLLAGGFTLAELKAQLMSELKWSAGTAGSQRAQVMAILEAFDVVTVNGEKHTLKA